MRHLCANGTATQNQQMLRLFLQAEDRFIGQKRHTFKPFNWRNGGRRTGGDDKALGRDGRVAGFQGLAVDKFALGFNNFNAEARKPFDTVHRLNGFDDITDMGHDFGKIDFRFGCRQTEISIGLICYCPIGRRQQSL